jgi:hypothetical protein
MPEKLQNQVEEIAGICHRLGISYEELADAAAINRETMRKYSNGYQPIPEATLRALHLVEQLRTLLAKQEKETPETKHVATAYSHLELDTLMKSFAELAAKLNRVSANDRKYVLGNLRAILDELDERERKSASLTPDDASLLAAKKALAEVEKPGVVYGRSRRAASTSGKSASPSSRVREGSGDQPAPPKPAPK